jgi:tetratricopeptide (TPR) repeat protein
VAAALALTALHVAAPAIAQEPPTQAVSPENKKAAAKSFAEGQKAFKKGDYRHAAESFDKAYELAPHHAPLWNSARAWHRADERARAANLYAKYLREAPPNARDRNSATEALSELKGQLARLEIHAPDLEDVRVDGEAVEGLSVYVTPGEHVIEARKGDRTVRQRQTVAAGAVVSTALVVPPDQPPPPPPPPPPKETGWSPWVVVAGGGLTAVGLGLTIWSGADTLSQKDTFDAARTQENLDAGRSKQTRTNVLLGVTIGVAALTGAAAIFFVDFGGEPAPDAAEAPSSRRPPEKVKVGLGFGYLSVERAF